MGNLLLCAMPHGVKLTRWKRVRRWLTSGPTQREIDEFEDWVGRGVRETIRVDVSQDSPDQPRERRLDAALIDKAQIASLVNLPLEWVAKLETAKCTFAEIRLQQAPGGRRVVLENLRVQVLGLPGGSRYTLRNCRIGQLETTTWVNVEIVDTWISSMQIDGMHHFLWRDGYLGKGTFDEANIRGDARFIGLYLNRSPARHGTQWLRSARACFTNNHNLPAAGAFHAAELIHDRQDQPFAARVVSLVYEAGSNFGGSIGRAAMWVVVIPVCIFLIAFQAGVQASPEATIGWQQELQGDELRAQFYRSAIYALNCVFNPLSLIVSKPLVTACNGAVAVLCSTVGILGTIAFALFVLSVRRRFKLE